MKELQVLLRLIATIEGGGSNQIPSDADVNAGAEDNAANAATAATAIGGTVLTSVIIAPLNWGATFIRL